MEKIDLIQNQLVVIQSSIDGLSTDTANQLLAVEYRLMERIRELEERLSICKCNKGE